MVAEMKSVQSSNIDAIGYDEVASELLVRFKGKPTVYAYPGVTKETYDAVVSAPSVGAAFSALVKKVILPELVRKVEVIIEAENPPNLVEKTDGNPA